MRRLRWVGPDEEVVNLRDPSLRQIARLGCALGIRFHFDVRPRCCDKPGCECHITRGEN